MALYFMKPAQKDENNNAFTTWLQSSMKSAGNAAVADQIKGLEDDHVELESIIRQASVLVKDHADDFNFPLKSDTQDEDEVFKVLLKEWKASQQSTKGMGKAVIVKQAHPYSIMPSDALTFTGKSFLTQHRTLTKGFTTALDPEVTTFLDYQTAPHTGGKAIGAP